MHTMFVLSQLKYSFVILEMTFICIEKYMMYIYYYGTSLSQVKTVDVDDDELNMRKFCKSCINAKMNEYDNCNMIEFVLM